VREKEHRVGTAEGSSEENEEAVGSFARVATLSCERRKTTTVDDDEERKKRSVGRPAGRTDGERSEYEGAHGSEERRVGRRMREKEEEEEERRGERKKERERREGEREHARRREMEREGDEAR